MKPVHENTEATPAIDNEPTAVPQPPYVAPQPDTAPPANHTPASTYILQWLTYAFWAWTLSVTSVLTGLVMLTLFNEGPTDTGNYYTYFIAAIAVLLPAAVVCDFLYQKREPAKKTGGATAIMAIHAVLFALAAVGVLISGIFALISISTEAMSDSASHAALSWFVSSIIIALLFGATFLRTINPMKRTVLIPRIYTIAVTVVVATIIVLAIVGPIAATARTKNDRLISSNLPAVARTIQNYTTKEKRLPENLNELSWYDEEAEKLIESDLVTYKQDEATEREYRYQLCVTYKEKSGTNSSYRSAYDDGSVGGYTSSPSTYYHPAGEVCYKLRVTKPNTTSLYDNYDY